MGWYIFGDRGRWWGDLAPFVVKIYIWEFSKNTTSLEQNPLCQPSIPVGSQRKQDPQVVGQLSQGRSSWSQFQIVPRTLISCDKNNTLYNVSRGQEGRLSPGTAMFPQLCSNKNPPHKSCERNIDAASQRGCSTQSLGHVSFVYYLSSFELPFLCSMLGTRGVIPQPASWYPETVSVSSMFRCVGLDGQSGWLVTEQVSLVST